MVCVDGLRSLERTTTSLPSNISNEIVYCFAFSKQFCTHFNHNLQHLLASFNAILTFHPWHWTVKSYEFKLEKLPDYIRDTMDWFIGYVIILYYFFSFLPTISIVFLFVNNCSHYISTLWLWCLIMLQHVLHDYNQT